MITQSALSYDFSFLEPFIDSTTMEIHYSKHHATYVKNLNNILENFPDFTEITSSEVVLQKIDLFPAEKRQSIINNAGGDFNHKFFWQILNPNGSKNPNQELLIEVEKIFGSFDDFKKRFTEESLKRFGSGWCWLVRDSNGILKVYSTANQDPVLLNKDLPLIGLDLWEHAYYLKYQNKRADYIDAFWNILDWSMVK